MARLMRALIVLAAIFVARPAFAGGTCPSAANYTNTSNPTGSLVNLSSLGVTSCYYVAANGSDSNSGTSESSPWLHAPMMPNCSSSCATVQDQTGGIPAGTGIILRGGDTWHFGNSSASPYTGGVWNFNTGQTPVGTSANPIYIGVDLSWYSGASWARPILTGDNPANSSTTLSSCMFQIGSQNAFFEISGLRYYVIDDFEMTGLCQSSVGQPGHHDVYFSYGGLSGPVWFLNHYMHGWSHVQFAGANGSTACTPTTVCINIFMFNGSVPGAGSNLPGETIAKVVIDGSDSDPAGAGFCFSGLYNAAYNVILGTSQCVTGTLHLFHDNIYGNFYENGHSNVLESGNLSDTAGTNAVYNNILYNLETSGSMSGGVGFWPSPPVGTTDYFFNNLSYNVGNMEIFNVGQNGFDQGTLVIFNNTWQLNPSNSQPVMRCTSTNNYPTTVANSHYILDGSSPYLSCLSNAQVTIVSDLSMTNATATSDGYMSSQTFALSPPASNSPTVGTGTNKQSFCSALAMAATSDSTLSDAATACGSDTLYACSYNTLNHTVSCPGRTAIPRPVNTAWDRGAYQFSASATAVNPPSNLAVLVQ